MILLWQWVDQLNLADGEKEAAAHLDVVKVASGFAVGGGGVFALYLSARRQRTQELELTHREAVHAHAVQVAEQSRLHAERVADDAWNDATTLGDVNCAKPLLWIIEVPIGLSLSAVNDERNALQFQQLLAHTFGASIVKFSQDGQ
ncbi:hypothetical protein GCM10029964_061400 [Kibdelosporangium lantanae]